MTERRMGRTCIIPLLLLKLTFGIVGAWQPFNVGALFDSKSSTLQDAFKYAVLLHNDNDTFPRFTIQYEKVWSINVSDSFSLSNVMCSLLSRGVFAIFGDSKPATFNVIQSFSHALHTPYILPTASKPHSATYEYDVSIMPTYIQAISDIISYNKWDKVCYIYDDDDGLWRLQSLYSSFSDTSWRPIIDARRINSENISYQLLRQIDSSGTKPKRIIIDLSSFEAYESMLDKIMDVGMNRDDYHYVIGGFFIEDLELEKFQFGGVNITGFRIINHDRTFNKLFHREWKERRNIHLFNSIFNTTNERIKPEAAFMIDGVSVFVESLRIIFPNSFTTLDSLMEQDYVLRNNRNASRCRSNPPIPLAYGDEILHAVRKVRLQGLTGNVEFDRRGMRTNYQIDVMEMKYKTGLKKVGKWSTHAGYKNFEEQKVTRVFIRNVTDNCTQEKRGTVECPIRITTIVAEPFVQYANRDGKEILEGYCIDLIDVLARELGIEYTIHLVKDGSYGRYKNGSWDGMIGEVARKEADMAVASLSITEDRETAVAFSTPFMKTGISIMIKKPEKQKPGVFSFMDPLSKNVWICITMGFISVSLILFLVGHFSPYEWQMEHSRKGLTLTNTFSLSNTIWFALGALMQQGSDISPRSISGRLVGSAWWFFTLILISSYTANLAAFLTIENMVAPIESADDLEKQSIISYGIQEGGSTQQFFEKSKIKLFQDMWAAMQRMPHVFVKDSDEGIAKVRNSKEKYAFLVESTTNDYHNQRKPCNTIRVGDDLDTKGYGIATLPDNRFRKNISIAVLKLAERGDLHKFFEKWWYSKGECGAADSQDKRQNPLTLSNVSGVFYILIGGLAFAMFSALIEYMFHSTLKSKLKELVKTSAKEHQNSKKPDEIREPRGNQEHDAFLNTHVCHSDHEDDHQYMNIPPPAKVYSDF